MRQRAVFLIVTRVVLFYLIFAFLKIVNKIINNHPDNNHDPEQNC